VVRPRAHTGNLGERIRDGVAGVKTMTEKSVTQVERGDGNAESAMMIENADALGDPKVVHQDQKTETKRGNGPSRSKIVEESLEADGVKLESDEAGGSISRFYIYSPFLLIDLVPRCHRHSMREPPPKSVTVIPNGSPSCLSL